MSEKSVTMWVTKWALTSGGPEKMVGRFDGTGDYFTKDHVYFRSDSNAEWRAADLDQLGCKL